MTSAIVQTIIIERILVQKEAAMTEIIVSPTSRLEGRPAKEYLGIVTGEVIVGARPFRGLLASVRDIVGGRSGGFGHGDTRPSCAKAS
jgi:hypothetical protein